MVIKNCECCDFLPLGRAIITMFDGGIVEAALFCCSKCRQIRLEHAACYASDIPPFEHPTE